MPLMEAMERDLVADAKCVNFTEVVTAAGSVRRMRLLLPVSFSVDEGRANDENVEKARSCSFMNEVKEGNPTCRSLGTWGRESSLRGDVDPIELTLLLSGALVQEQLIGLEDTTPRVTALP